MRLPVDGVPILPSDIIAPEKQVLRCTTQRLYSIPPEQRPLEAEFEGLRLRECHVPKPQPNLPQHIGEYTITIEATIETSGQLNEASLKISALAYDLDMFWTYSCGRPLFPMTFGLTFDVTPKGWQSNLESVKEYFLTNCRKQFAVIQVRNPDWVAMPYYPLRLALQAHENYHKFDTSIKALVDLHYLALKSPLAEGRLFLFAKALELVRKILPGNDDTSKEMSLCMANGSLKRTFHWLFDVGNNRFNTRHVVRKDSVTPALLPHMTGPELADYEHDADLILRTIVCQKMQIPVPNLQPANKRK